MKKKLLSLVLAGAMVASTSVSAFAAANTEDVDVQANTPKQIEVPIQGDIESSDGTTVAGSITVTVPTSAAFKVDKKGNLESGAMKITNKGNSTVSVIASKFIDTTGTNKINVVKEGQLDEHDRSKVSLKLIGGDKDIVLTSEDNGKMYDATDDSVISENSDFVIKNVAASESLSLQLKGQGSAYVDGTNDKKAVSDNFKLILKIKQER